MIWNVYLLSVLVAVSIDRYTLIFTLVDVYVGIEIVAYVILLVEAVSTEK